MIKVKTKEEIEVMAQGGRILAEVLHQVALKAAPGVTTLELDALAEDLILKKGATPAFKGYENFPYALCTSVNEVIVHGFPSSYMLKEGDIVGLDLGVKYKGYNTDMAVTVAIGEVSYEAKRLLNITQTALRIGIKQAKPGNTIGDIGSAIQQYIESHGFGVVRELCGHGIGKGVHEDPLVPNYGSKRKGVKLREGMVICIEPMATIGDWKVKRAGDGYGFATKDGSLGTQFEHTIALTENGCRILTEA